MMMMIGGNSQVTTPNEGGGAKNVNDGGEGGVTLKKGPWTAAEDAVLAEYVRTHGEGNWNAVQKNTGLLRCGKSCRLRWVNHLRPNLKKGSFSPEEERIIVELHAKLGNKWARMATQLPGRTDNEIKNYWNTRVKRRQRQGLSLYPLDIQPLHQQHHHSQPATPIASSPTPLTPPGSSFSFQAPTSLTPPSPHSLHPHRSASQPSLLNYQAPPHSLYSPGPASTPPPLPSPSPSTPPPSSPLPSPHRPAFSTLPLFDSSTSNATPTSNITTASTSDFFFPRPSPFLQVPLRYKRLRHGGDSEITSNTNNNGHNIAVNGSSNSITSSFMFPISPSLRSTNLFNPPTTAAAAAVASTCSLSPKNYPSSSSDAIMVDLASSARILGSPHFDPGQFISTPGYVSPLKMELPSNQFLSQDGQSEVSLHTKGNNNYSRNNDQNENHHNWSMPSNGNGLLEDLLEEAHVMAGSNYILRRGFDSSSDQCFASSSSAFKAKEAAAEEMSTGHDDYTKFLNPIPSSMPMPEWYSDSGEGSNGQSSVIII